MTDKIKQIKEQLQSEFERVNIEFKGHCGEGLSCDATIWLIHDKLYVRKSVKIDERGNLASENFAINTMETEAYLTEGFNSMISNDEKVLSSLMMHFESDGQQEEYTLQEFILNSTALTNETLSKHVKKVAKALSNLHNVDTRIFHFSHKLEGLANMHVDAMWSQYLKSLGRYNLKLAKEYAKVQREFYLINHLVSTYFEERVLCHGDALAANFMLTDDDSMYLIDFEYTSMSYPLWDLVSVVTEAKLSYSAASKFISDYIETRPENSELKRCLDKGDFNVLFQAITYLQNRLWSLWGYAKSYNPTTLQLVDVDLYDWATEKANNVDEKGVKDIINSLIYDLK